MSESRSDGFGARTARGARTPAPLLRRSVRLVAAAGLSAAVTLALLARGPAEVADAQGRPLSLAEITNVIADCLFYARQVPSRPDLTVAVVDPEGNALGVFHASGVPSGTMDADIERANRAAVALAKAGTGAYFSSDQQTFSTRSAAFIIQDHFPPGLLNGPGGPLYGVEFSSFATSDVNPIVFPPATGFPATFLPPFTNAKYRTPAVAELRVRGDNGGIALYRGQKRIAGLGIDDGALGKRVTIPPRVLSFDGCTEEYRITFGNLDSGRDLERIVGAAANANRMLAAPRIRATEITVDGIRLPYLKPTRLGRSRAEPLTPGADGDFDPAFPLTEPTTITSHFTRFTLDPPPGAGAGQQSYVVEVPTAFPFRDSTDGILTQADVTRMLWQGVRQANITRAAIRRPLGVKMQCWVTVVDTNGEVLGVVRFAPDATLFSYDVAVQKARTASFFSDDQVALTTRAVGLLSQNFYPAGQQDDGRGPLFQLQDGITVGLLTGAIPGAGFPIRNGITVFPGGVPLYKDGVHAGGLGVSGDGIDQDDIVADLGSRGFGAPADIRCDNISGAKLKSAVGRALDRLAQFAPAPPATPLPSTAPLGDVGACFFLERLRVARATLLRTHLDVGVPYVKHPRHPGPVTRR